MCSRQCCTETDRRGCAARISCDELAVLGFESRLKDVVSCCCSSVTRAVVTKRLNWGVGGGGG